MYTHTGALIHADEEFLALPCGSCKILPNYSALECSEDPVRSYQ